MKIVGELPPLQLYSSGSEWQLYRVRGGRSQPSVRVKIAVQTPSGVDYWWIENDPELVDSMRQLSVGVKFGGKYKLSSISYALICAIRH